MAQHKSAEKRIRRNNRARVRNREYMASVRTAVKKFRAAATNAAAGTFDKGALAPLFVTAQSLLAKAGAKGILHGNNVSRKIGRLSALLKRVQEASAPVAAAGAKKTTAKKAPAAAAAPKAAAAKKAPAAKKTTKPAK